MLEPTADTAKTLADELAAAQVGIKPWAATLLPYMGQPVAVLCARFQYRGVLSEINQWHIVLANATLVELSGSALGAAPQTEDPVGSSVILSLLAVETVYQPNWCKAPLPGA